MQTKTTEHIAKPCTTYVYISVKQDERQRTKRLFSPARAFANSSKHTKSLYHASKHIKAQKDNAKDKHMIRNDTKLQGMAKQGNTRQGEARQGKARQGKAGQDKNRQDKTK